MKTSYRIAMNRTETEGGSSRRLQVRDEVKNVRVDSLEKRDQCPSLVAIERVDPVSVAGRVRVEQELENMA